MDELDERRIAKSRIEPHATWSARLFLNPHLLKRPGFSRLER